MNRLVSLGLLGLASALAFSACSDDEDGGGPGSGGTGGAAGSDGNAGTGGAAGGGNGGTGGGGAGGTGGQTGESCTGCLHIFVPMDSTGDQAEVEVNYNTAPVDLSNTVVRARVRAATGTTGAVQVYVKNGQAQGFASYYAGYTLFSALSAFTDVVVDLTPCSVPATPPDADAGADAGEPPPVADAGDAGGDAGGLAPCTDNPAFDTRAIQFVGVQVLSGDAAGTFTDANIYVDSITFSDGATPNFTFDSDVQGFALNTFAPVTAPTGTALTFQGP